MPYVASSIQLVLFTEGTSRNAATLWTEANLGELQGFQTVEPGHTQAIGELDANTQLLVAAQAERVDIIAQPVAPTSPETFPPTLSDFSGNLNTLVGISARLFPLISVKRVATVIQGQASTDSDPASVEVVKASVIGLPVPADTTGLLYQVAGAARSNDNSRSIKPLIKWQTVQAQSVEFRNVGSTQTPRLKTHYAAHLYVDVYSEHPEDLNLQSGVQLLQEVANLAEEAFTAGYNVVG